VDETTLDRITRLITDFNAQVAKIRADKHLSDLGRHDKIVALTDKTRDEATRLRGDADAKAGARRKALQQRLFGLSPHASSSDVISYRDAQDRVERVKDPEELGNLMERAATIGDRSLLKAGFAKAFERSRNALNGGKWEGLVSEYVNDFPEVADDVSEYQQLTSSRALTAEFAERMATSVPTPPEYHDRSVLSDETPKPTAGDTMRAMLSAAPRGPRYQGDGY
jgi:hypothetical protein